MKVLVTCPPMLGMIDTFLPEFAKYGFEVSAPNVVQALSVDELKAIVPLHDGWIIGDDPATREVFSSGVAGKLKAAVKWGIGVDNVDFSACQDLGIPIVNTPNMFGAEVADVAVGYLIALARETFQIHQRVCDGEWYKPRGISLAGKRVALVGFGDIGKAVAKRLLAADMLVNVYDPVSLDCPDLMGVARLSWPERISDADFIVITCALNSSSFHLIDEKILGVAKDGVRIINVARGPIIDEAALENALISGRVYSAALDVFEHEPLPINSTLRTHARCIFGSHNASNTADAVTRTSKLAIKKLAEFLKCHD